MATPVGRPPTESTRWMSPACWQKITHRVLVSLLDHDAERRPDRETRGAKFHLRIGVVV